MPEKSTRGGNGLQKVVFTLLNARCVAAAILALLHAFYNPHIRVGHRIKRLNEKIPADVSQQGLFWIKFPSLC